MNKAEELYVPAKVPTCENFDCRENRKGRCILQLIVINSEGKCGWCLPRTNEAN